MGNLFLVEASHYISLCAFFGAKVISLVIFDVESNGDVELGHFTLFATLHFLGKSKCLELNVINSKLLKK